MFARGSEDSSPARSGCCVAGWQRSSHCGTDADCYSSNCVEVLAEPDLVRLRDSASPAGAVLTFDRAAWTAFLRAIEHGGLARR
jgi:hypothetical protein